jgi:Ca2+-binding RTX toxin-like protein
MAFVVFAGQSNTGGYGQAASTLPQPWTPDPLTLIWNSSDKVWAPMQPGQNTGYPGQSSTWGPEVEFARAFRAAHPGEVLRIVKHAEGGTGLALDPTQWAYDWSPGSDQELFDRVKAIIQDASAAAGGDRPDAVFWGQGEEDGTEWGSARDYGENLQVFLGAVRAEWMADGAGKVGFYLVDTSTPFAGEVRSGQQLADQRDPNAESFDTATFPMQSDSLHYAAEGFGLMGAEYFRLYQGWFPSGSVAGGPGQQLNGNAWADTLMGGAADDSIAGGAGLDLLRGAEGRDLMSGGDDFDDMHGNQGNDTLSGGNGDDWVVGGKDNDRLFGDEGGDVVLGNMGDDFCDGGAGADIVRGGQGADQVIGLAGDDWLSGDRGDDTVSGGSGADIFHSFGEAGIDRVMDFSRADGDRVQLDPGTTWRVEQQGADAVILLGGGAQVILVGVSTANLTGDWLFIA